MLRITQKKGKPSIILPSVDQIHEFQELLLEWHSQNYRDFPWRNESSSCYEKIIAEILLQRTKAETVAKVFTAFLTRFQSWEKIVESSNEDLEYYLRPLGLWKRRSISIRKLAIEMNKREGVFPSSRRNLEELPNIGQYIANAVLLLCYGEPNPLLDINMARVLERYFGPRKLVDIRDDPYLQSLSYKVIAHDDPVLMNWAILDLSMLICKPTPLSKICPLVKKCHYATMHESS